MSPLAVVVLGAEAGTLGAFALYASVLASMHREARHMDHELPRLDPVGRALQSAAKYGFRAGIAGVVIGSLYLGGLT